MRCGKAGRRKSAAIGLTVGFLAMWSVAFARSSPSAAVTQIPVANITVVNVGRGTKGVPATAHFHVSAITPSQLRLTKASVIMIPSSSFSKLSLIDIGQLKKKLAHGTFVIEWKDDASPVFAPSLDHALGLPDVADSSKIPRARLDHLFAAGWVVLPGGVPDRLSFVSNGSVTGPLNLLGVQAIWGGLNALKAAMPRVPPQRPEIRIALSGPSSTTYVDGTNGEIEVAEDLTMSRVNDNSLSVWTDKSFYAVIPGSQLYRDGQTQFNGDMNTSTIWTSSYDAYGRTVTEALPDPTPSAETISAGVSTAGIGLAWSSGNVGVNVLNESDTSMAKWELACKASTMSAEAMYDAPFDWQMLNTSNGFVYTRVILATWRNWWSEFPTRPSRFSTIESVHLRANDPSAR